MFLEVLRCLSKVFAGLVEAWGMPSFSECDSIIWGLVPFHLPWFLGKEKRYVLRGASMLIDDLVTLMILRIA